MLSFSHLARAFRLKVCFSSVIPPANNTFRMKTETDIQQIQHRNTT